MIDESAVRRKPWHNPPMPVRKARPSEFSRIRELAARDDLDYEDMGRDRFWAAVEAGRVVGACGAAEHPDCLELRSLAVGEPSRGRGWGRRHVAALPKRRPRRPVNR